MTCKLFLTFDHELPLGGLRSSYDEALFEPTYRLLGIADEMQFPLTLFTDVLCAIRFREWDSSGFYEPYLAQLKDAVIRNHDVQLHIHPHWLTSVHNGTTFLSSSDFSLEHFSNHPDFSIEEIIKLGVDFLKKNCGSYDQEYKCIAYRAGGYNITHKSTAAVFDSLINNGICFDSSVCKGYYFASALSEVDFCDMPDVPNWYIGKNGNIRDIAASGVLEIPIAGVKKSPFDIPTRFKLKKFAQRAPADHGWQVHEEGAKGFTKKWKQLFSSRMLTFDNYTYSSGYLMKILDDNINNYKHSDEIMLCAIGHPKSMSDYSFRLLREFVDAARKKYKDQIQFSSYSKVYKELYS